MQAIVSQELVQHLFNYNPETGDLIWKIQMLVEFLKET